MSLIQVGLVDKTKGASLDPALVKAAADALNVQVVHDIPQFWDVQATVRYLTNPKHIPAGVWPVFLVDHLPPGEGGFHMDQHNQPYAKVIASKNSEDWTIDASHEIVEMLVDPYGNRMQTSRAIEIDAQGNIVDGTGQFSYLVEAADPCEANQYAYQIEGIAVSDFITPHFYDSGASPGTKFSFTGAVQRPRQILPGGYISYVNLEANQWEQILWVDPSQRPQLQVLGPATNARSIREWIDATEMSRRLETGYAKPRNDALMQYCRERRERLSAIARTRGAMYAA